MQLFGLHRSIYNLARYARTQETDKQETQRRLKLLGDWELLKKRGVPEVEIARITGLSRSSYYRRKKAIQIYGLSGVERRSRRPRRLRQSKISYPVTKLILKLRLDNPTYGKGKITVLLRRDHATTLSESSVGRILKKLMTDQKITHYHACAAMRKKRTFKGHAKRFPYGMKPHKPGELIQIDHMTVTKNGRSFKHFQAWDPLTKIIIADITTNATSAAAAQFLEKVQNQLPFQISSIQVDGGSEFMRDFEKILCPEKYPPLRPTP